MGSKVGNRVATMVGVARSVEKTELIGGIKKII